MRLEELREELLEEQQRSTEKKTDDAAPGFSYEYGDEGRIRKRFQDGHYEECLPYPYSDIYGPGYNYD